MDQLGGDDDWMSESHLVLEDAGPNSEGVGDDVSEAEEDVDAQSAQEYPISTVTIHGIEIKFPGTVTEDHSLVLEGCLSNLREGKNCFLEFPSDEERRLVTLTSLLAHHQNQGRLNPAGRSFPSSAQKPIFYATRSFEDMPHVIESLKRLKNTGYLTNIIMAILAPPSKLCSNCDGVLPCSLPSSPETPFNFIEETGHIHQISTLTNKGQREMFCPFHYNMELVPRANFILCPQEFLISSDLRLKYPIDLRNAIVIFDDGGNIENAFYAEASVSITTAKLRKAEQAFNSLGTAILEYNQSRRDVELQEIAQRVHQFSRWLGPLANAIEVQLQGNLLRANDQILNNLESNGVSQEQNKNRREFIRQVLNLLETDLELRRSIDIQLVLDIQKLLSSLAYMYNSIAKKHMKDFGLEISEYRNFITFKISHANLSAIIEPVINSESCVIISSACLPPVDILRQQLSLSPDAEFENVIVPKHDQTRSFFAYCSKSPNDVSFALSSSNRPRVTVHEESGEAILNVIRMVKGGVVVFFPSKGALEDNKKAWGKEDNRRQSIWEEMKQLKHVLCELDFLPAEDAKLKLAIFRDLCLSPSEGKTGAILFALHRERVSELMDFKPGEVQCFVSLGIPYHSIKAFNIETKKKFILSKGPVNGESGERRNNLWYNAEAFHIQNEKFVHCIRKGQEQFVGLIFDDRMKKKADAGEKETLLPQWMRNEWKEYNNFSTMMGNLQRFVEVFDV